MKEKKIGATLTEAGLISEFQLKTALKEQKYFPQFRLGEILVIHKWIKPQSINFFLEKWSSLLEKEDKKLFGFYLQEAYLLTPEQINLILAIQKKLLAQYQVKLKFGEVVILKGLLSQTTIDFFVKNIVSDSESSNLIITNYPEVFRLKNILFQEQLSNFEKLYAS